MKLAYYDGTGDGAAIVLVDGTPTERLLAALEIAWQIHTTVPEVIGPFGPFQVRIGIERSEDLLLVSTEEAPYKLEAVGESLTMAARLQDAGKRKELFCERTIILRQGLAEEAEGEWEFECPDLHGHQLRDVDEGVKLARVVGRK